MAGLSAEEPTLNTFPKGPTLIRSIGITRGNSVFCSLSHLYPRDYPGDRQVWAKAHKRTTRNSVRLRTVGVALQMTSRHGPATFRHESGNARSASLVGASF